MNAHRRAEAKRARRRKRTTGTTRGNVRGPVTRGAARAGLMREGERRVLAMIASTHAHAFLAVPGTRLVRCRCGRLRRA